MVLLSGNGTRFCSRVRQLGGLLKCADTTLPRNNLTCAIRKNIRPNFCYITGKDVYSGINLYININVAKSCKLPGKLTLTSNNVREYSTSSALSDDKNTPNLGDRSKIEHLSDNYYIKVVDKQSQCYLLGITRKKLKNFKEVVYISFTREATVKKGDYLFSIEDSKTLYEFNSPVDAKIVELNPKLENSANEEVLKEFLKSPEDCDNFLAKIQLM